MPEKFLPTSKLNGRNQSYTYSLNLPVMQIKHEVFKSILPSVKRVTEHSLGFIEDSPIAHLRGADLSCSLTSQGRHTWQWSSASFANYLPHQPTAGIPTSTYVHKDSSIPQAALQRSFLSILKEHNHLQGRKEMMVLNVRGVLGEIPR